MASNKMTLLDMVQDILSDMSSDAVNSLNDTVESLQVAQIIKSTYLFMIAKMDRPWLGTLFQLESGTTTYPTRMRMPDDISEINWIKYNKKLVSDTRERWGDVVRKTPEEFIDALYLRNSSADNVETVLIVENVPLFIFNDRAPTMWTTFDDEYIIFDNYDSDVETNLQSSKTSCHGIKEPTWSESDTFTPDLPSSMFPFLLAESKATCMLRLKQSQDPKAEKMARDGKTRAQYSQWRTKRQDSIPDFGRKR
jgi:hypothetical protein